MRRYSFYGQKKGGFIKFFILGLVIIVLFLGAGAFVTVRTYQKNLKPVSANQKRVTVTIEEGASVSDISRLLKEHELIRSSWAFEYYVRDKNVQGYLKAGTYTLQASQSVPEIVDTLTSGLISTNLVTIPPGYRIDQVKKTLLEHGYSEAEINEALKPASHKNHPVLKGLPTGASLEGFIYPESFQKDSTVSAKALVEKYLDEMYKRLTPAIKKGITDQGLTLYQGIILASIIEQEVSSGPDRQKVAQVFLKRLNENMALGADATAPYGAVLAGTEPSLFYDSPYNTHKYKGLPPGPISNVSDTSLQAVAFPADTDWLYFVSGDDGITYFSKTLAEHEALTAQHCKKLCSGE